LFWQEITDYVATEIAKFVSAHPEIEETAPAKKKKLGFTLSYPVDEVIPFSATAFQRKNANKPVEFSTHTSYIATKVLIFFRVGRLKHSCCGSRFAKER